MIGLGDGPIAVRCSRAGCGQPALWNVNWRNPKIHDETRVKVWLACDDHRDYLRDYLSARDFPVQVTPVGETVTRVQPA